MNEIEKMFKWMEYDYITDNQHKLIESFEQQYTTKGNLSKKQFQILKSIFEQAASKYESEWVEWSKK